MPEHKDIDWKIPDWMEQYRSAIDNPCQQSIEDLMNAQDLSDPTTRTYATCIHGQISLLTALHNKGKAHTIAYACKMLADRALHLSTVASSRDGYTEIARDAGIIAAAIDLLLHALTGRERY